MSKSELTIIEVLWKGPFTFKEIINKKNEPSDYGIYQIYGTHTIFGPGSLLYIGQANQQNFSTRILQHKEWIDKEPKEVEIYLGRIGSSDNNANDRKEYINIAESLLIYYCCPPYNSSSVVGYGNIKKTIVINLGKKNMIPYEVSTLCEESEYLKNDSKWKVFSE